MDIPTLAGITKERITSARLSTRVLLCGPPDGIPVLFLHGVTLAATFWEETMLALPAGYRAIAPDLRGHGGADPAALVDATRGAGDQSDDAFALLDALGITRAHVVGHSYGGFIVFDMIRKNPQRIISASVVTPAPPYGFGTRDAVGTLTAPDGAGTGRAQLPQPLVEAISKGELADARAGLSVCCRPPFQPARIDDFARAFLTTHAGPQSFPGDSVASVHWPFTGPGKFGAINSLSGLYTRTARLACSAEGAKPFVWWAWGKDDVVVNEGKSVLDAATHGAMGTIPMWPGAHAYPGTPCITQTRAVLEEYQADGGRFAETSFDETGHSPFLEKPEEFNKLLHKVLAGTL
jgi:pimeloyl-ACP methyl ester carboxylesterase